MPEGFIVTVQEKAWVDEGIMLRWVTECLRKYTNRERSLLVMDSFRCHIMDSVKKSLRKANVETAIIPGGCTSVLQPLDVSLNKPFKGWVRASWAEYIRNDAIRVDRERKAGDQLAKIRPPSKQAVVDWIASAVKNLSKKVDMVKKSFIVTGISPALNGAQDHLVRKDDENNDNSDSDGENDFLGFGDEANVHSTIDSDLSDSDVTVSSDDDDSE